MWKCGPQNTYTSDCFKGILHAIFRFVIAVLICTYDSLFLLSKLPPPIRFSFLSIVSVKWMLFVSETCHVKGRFTHIFFFWSLKGACILTHEIKISISLIANSESFCKCLPFACCGSYLCSGGLSWTVDGCIHRALNNNLTNADIYK